MSAIRIYKEDEPEYRLLQDFCDYLNKHTTDRYRFFMRNILFDAGQDWWYTAILSEDTAIEGGSILRTWQTCTPACYALILQGREYFSEAAKDVFKIHTFTNPPKSMYDLTCVSREFGGSALTEQVRGETKASHTLTDAVGQALNLGIFTIQEGAMEYGCMDDIICHVHDPSDTAALNDREFYYETRPNGADGIAATISDMTVSYGLHEEGMYYLNLLKKYLDTSYHAAIDEAIHAGEEAAKEWENDYEEEQ